MNTIVSKALLIPHEQLVGLNVGMFLQGEQRGTVDPDVIRPLLQNGEVLELQANNGTIIPGRLQVFGQVGADGQPVLTWTKM